MQVNSSDAGIMGKTSNRLVKQKSLVKKEQYFFMLSIEFSCQIT